MAHQVTISRVALHALRACRGSIFGGPPTRSIVRQFLLTGPV